MGVFINRNGNCFVKNMKVGTWNVRKAELIEKVTINNLFRVENVMRYSFPS
jgi:hypothetical protein